MPKNRAVAGERVRFLRMGNPPQTCPVFCQRARRSSAPRSLRLDHRPLAERTCARPREKCPLPLAALVRIAVGSAGSTGWVSTPGGIVIAERDGSANPNALSFRSRERLRRTGTLDGQLASFYGRSLMKAVRGFGEDGSVAPRSASLRSAMAIWVVMSLNPLSASGASLSLQT